jgi:UDP-N-acetylglucosamine--N-acetylmuramyl-(pentapeptide) pyrophosphoryl-undecaprenol N-acetylglucosamine transferase
LCIKAKPSILVPSPNVAEDHQTKNTMALKRKNAAILVRDQDCRRMLVKKVLELAKDQQLREELKTNIEKLAYPFAAQDIAKAAIQMTIKTRNQ